MSSFSHFLSKKFQHICVSLDVNFNESLTNDIVSFEQLGPDFLLTIPRWVTLSVGSVFFSLLSCRVQQDKGYGFVELVSLPNHTFSCAGLVLSVYILLPETDNCLS